MDGLSVSKKKARINISIAIVKQSWLALPMRIQVCIDRCAHRRILYLVSFGTWLMTKRPSYDIDANTHGSAPLQSGIANILVWNKTRYESLHLPGRKETNVPICRVASHSVPSTHLHSTA
jgi:hypothetical protein